MSFFKKKEKNFDSKVPEFDPIPLETPKVSSEIPKLPDYGQEFGTIKKEVGRPSPVKIRKPEIVERKKISSGSIPIGDKPIFVKIDNYKSAMEDIHKIKELCSEADGLLDDIHKIRTEENKELERWNSDLDKIKEKLLNVDRKLFEM
ncbi:hypothetical protein HOG16_04320 [Candidatus Woesearchaeota archaeon]|jgi:hypothetical protein|nr:hypothetical protein [Candidatus Woesearchaeota archaeon]MBT4322245.1 hypothetical protein [Candidatus Woesearchaeota archaeon]MBT4631265.1 hypothetical protein [Candidatus Woesearchaeota archaeon]